MKEAKGVGDIFQRDIVCDDVFLQPGGEGFAEYRLCVKKVALFRWGDEKVSTQLSLGSQRAGTNGGTGSKAQDVVGKLAV
jgi:hypothetical protein